MPEHNQRSATSVQILQAVAADRQGILKCLVEAFEPYRGQYTAGAYKDTVLDNETLETRMRTMHVLIALANGEIIGTVAGFGSDAGEGHLRGMAVLPRYKGTGVSAQLLAAIEAWLQTRGCTRVTLDTTVPLLAAMKFYEKHGYSRSGRTSDFFGMSLIEYVKQIS